MAFHAPFNGNANESDNNDVIIHIGDVDSLDDNTPTYHSSYTMADDTLAPPAGMAATVIRRAIEIDLDTAVGPGAATTSSSSSSSSPTTAEPASMVSSMTSSFSSSSSPTARHIPRTSASRLALATPDVCPEAPVLASKYLAQTQTSSEKTPLLSSTELSSTELSSSSPATPSSTEPTILYLAYGSNMAASTFEGTRRIKPLSCTTVAAPTLRLTFDLPGVPYREPCFANTAFRRPPKSPKVPDIPDVPDLPIPAPPGPPGPPTNPNPSPPPVEVDSHGDPIWDGPLYGVVYEVTRDDYAKIIATEGGGASYQDVLVPCLVVAPRMGVPEKPAVPVPPRPFLAHTLFAPQVKSEQSLAEDDDDDDDDDNWLARRWRALVRRLVRFGSTRGRPDPGYAQPSKRYLGLLATGAAEHELPEAYQDWLASLQPYTITTRRQAVGSFLLLVTAFPALLVILAVGWLPRRKGTTGRMSPAMIIVMGTIFRSVWWVYDHVFHPVFGDGERTEPKKEAMLIKE